MKRFIKRKILVIAAALFFIAGSVTALAAAGGSEANPLVTLSYLKTVFTQTILQETNTKLTTAEAKYTKALDDKIAGYKTELQNSGVGGGSVSFVLVDLPNGKTLTAKNGTELMLRSGSAQCVSADSPGLINSTTGSILDYGGNLEKNHLYLAGADNRGVKATSGSVKLLVRGSYSIS